MNNLIRLGCLVFLTSTSIHVWAAEPSASAAAHAETAASQAAIARQTQKANKDAKIQLGVAKYKCGGMQGDEKTHCEKDAVRRARTVHKEESPRPASK